jgi:hypothetical protein
MSSARRTPPLARALDEVAFGPARTLDLRTGLPSVADALARAEAWLRERQMAKAGRVLIITGRGAGSPGGEGAIRTAVRSLLARLRRVGVVASTREHTPGSVIVELATIRALFESPPRARGAQPGNHQTVDPAALSALDVETRAELRLLAQYSLVQLGAPTEPGFVEDEMLRHFSVLAGSIASDETDRAGRFRFLVTAARRAYEEA